MSLGTVGGKRRRKTVYGATKGEVLKELRRLQSDFGLGQMGDPQGATIEGYLHMWVDTTAKSRVAPATYERYRLVVDNNLIPNIGHLKLERLTAFHVANLYHAMKEQGESVRAQQMAGTVLHTALKAAVRLGLITSNPVSNALRPKTQKTELQVWNAGQVHAFLDGAKGDRLYPLFVLALDTGARLGELLGLQWGDVDFETGVVSINRSLEELRGKLRLKDPKTKRARRRIILSPFALAALNEHRREMMREGNIRGQVFCDHNGGFLRQSNIRRRNFLACIKRANQKLTEAAAKINTAPMLLPTIRMHDLRHTAATLLLQAGVNVKVVSERLGHEKIQITLDTYSHVLPGMQEIAAEAMRKVFSPAVPENGSKTAVNSGSESS